jgi:hydroxymethylpyrimidine pyrophosphatase-like HAD family hydrolase
MELFVFLDLDDTIFQTKRKCPPEATITPASFSIDGSPLSFFTAKQARLFNLLNSKTRLIPTTARDSHAFKRTHVQEYDYAIINHGGIILHADGSCHQGWFTLMQHALDNFKQALQQIEKMLLTHAQQHQLGLNIRLITDMGLTFYCLIKHKQRDNQLLKTLLNDVIQPYLQQQQLDFYCHLNDNNLAILPRILNKAPAVKFLQQELDKHYPDYLSFGIGDSLTDIAYMQLCDYFMTPKNSQIVRECINPHYQFHYVEV